MKDQISLGSVPCYEESAQVGQPGYLERAHEECGRFQRLLQNTYCARWGTVPAGFAITIKTCPHDFGDYLDVVVMFDGDNEAAARAAAWLENNVPQEWPHE
jgi:hypothetical protein